MREMTPSYSIIQYSADPSKHETLNVGVVVFDPNNGRVLVELASNFQRLQKVFRDSNFEFLSLALEDFVSNLNSVFLEAGDLGEVEKFRRLRSNNLKLTPILPTYANDLEAEKDRLFRALVSEEPMRTRKSPVAASMRKQLKKFQVLELFDRKPEPVVIPRYDLVLKPDLAIRREKYKIIEATRFDEKGHGLEQAGKMALAGRALAKTDRTRLIVVGDFGSQPAGFYNAIKEDLVQSETELFRLEELSQLADSVRLH